MQMGEYKRGSRMEDQFCIGDDGGGLLVRVWGLYFFCFLCYYKKLQKVVGCVFILVNGVFCFCLYLLFMFSSFWLLILVVGIYSYCNLWFILVFYGLVIYCCCRMCCFYVLDLKSFVYYFVCVGCRGEEFKVDY